MCCIAVPKIIFIIFKSKLFHNETVDGIEDVKDILSLLLGVA
jgi:hypothetical protein